MKKGYRIAYLILGIVFIILGLLLALATWIGFVAVAFGILLIVLSRSSKPKETSSRVSTNKVSVSNATSNSKKISPQVSTNNVPDSNANPKPKERVENFRVAGITNYTENVEALATENSDYDLSKSELKEDGPSDERIYQYDFYPNKVELIAEPDNEYDPNAVMVIVDGEKIGYIKKGSCSHVKNLLSSEDFVKASVKIGGGKYKYYSSDDDSIEKDSTNYWAEISIHSKNNEVEY